MPAVLVVALVRPDAWVERYAEPAPEEFGGIAGFMVVDSQGKWTGKIMRMGHMGDVAFDEIADAIADPEQRRQVVLVQGHRTRADELRFLRP